MSRLTFDVTLKCPDTGKPNEEGVELLKRMLTIHDEVVIVSSRINRWESVVEIRDFLRENISRDNLRIFLCGDWKFKTLQEIGVVFHVDDDPHEAILNRRVNIPTLLIGLEKDLDLDSLEPFVTI